MAKSYKELKTQVRKKFNVNFDHVDFNECFTNKVEGKIFLDHYTFMRGLIEGTIKPNSENHVNFINTVKLYILKAYLLVNPTPVVPAITIFLKISISLIHQT